MKENYVWSLTSGSSSALCTASQRKKNTISPTWSNDKCISMWNMKRWRSKKQNCMRYALWFTDQSVLVGAGIQDKDLPRNQNLLFYAGYPPHRQGWKHTSFRSIFYLFPMLYTVLSPSFRATAMAPYEYHQLHKILLQMLMLVAAEKKELCYRQETCDSGLPDQA